MAGNGPRKSAAAGTKKRSAAEYIQEVRDYVAEHGRPPRHSPSVAGTAEYKLRNKIQFQVRKGRFSEEERGELARLCAQSAPAGGAAMAGTHYIQQVRDFVAQHGRPPRSSSKRVGTAEYKLRRRVQEQVKKGRFSEQELMVLMPLLERRAPAGGAAMAGIGPRKAAAAGQVPVDSASKRNYSAAAASGLQAGVVTEVAAPATPAVTCCRGDAARQPSPAAGATPHGSAAQRRLRGQIPPNLFRPEERIRLPSHRASCACGLRPLLNRGAREIKRGRERGQLIRTCSYTRDMESCGVARDKERVKESD